VTILCSGVATGVPDYFCRGWHEYTATARDPELDWRDVFPADDRERFDRCLATLLRTGVASEIELGMIRRDGTIGLKRVGLVAADGATGLTRWFAIVDEARTPAVDRIDRLLAWVSHELRAPIATMLLWEQVLRAAPTADIVVRGLDAIRQSAQTQERLVRDLLDATRATSGKLHLEMRPVNLARSVEDAIEALEQTATDKSQRVVRHLETKLEVNGDAGRLRQVLDNLLSNAVKFTQPGGTITVRARRLGASIVVEVADSGCGMSREFLAHAFELFSQADNSATRKDGGLGIGLAIAHDIVHLHGGTLTGQSDGVDRGTTFTITLPALTSTPDVATIPAVATIRLDGIRVLVVDDDPRVCDALEILLSRVGAAVDTATSVAAAIAALDRAEPDVVLSDIAMPGEDGYSLVRRIRARALAMPVVAITAHAGASEQAIVAGFDRFVAKPLDVAYLIELISGLVEGRRTG